MAGKLKQENLELGAAQEMQPINDMLMLHAPTAGGELLAWVE